MFIYCLHKTITAFKQNLCSWLKYNPIERISPKTSFIFFKSQPLKNVNIQKPFQYLAFGLISNQECTLRLNQKARFCWVGDGMKTVLNFLCRTSSCHTTPGLQVIFLMSFLVPDIERKRQSSF